MTFAQQEYARWASLEPEGTPLAEDIRAMRDDPKAIEESFYAPLEFGTAGLRGILGAGTNRMNSRVVARAAAGLASYILTFPNGAARGVAIAYDSRRMSAGFALETACTLAAFGVKAKLFPSLRPVPLLSFAVRHLGCIAGVVITASHNPPSYNGFKVYWGDGGQAGPSQAEKIFGYMKRLDYYGLPTTDEAAARAAGLIETIPRETDEAYYKATASLLQWPDLLMREGGNAKIVYTPLHGAGLVPVTELLARVGVTNVSVVKEQAKPDPAFPTVKAPNPEDPEAFTLALTLADSIGADTAVATDPDSDRLGLAVREKSGGFRLLTGNMTGCLLLQYLLSSMREKGTLPADGFAVKSLVSTRLANAVCDSFGIKCIDVPTGFRFISEKIDESVKTGVGTFIFGFEESYGFLAGGFSRDKDAVCAAMLACEAVVYYAHRGMTLCDVLDAMAEEYGHFGERVKSYTLTGREGLERIAGAMRKLRREPPARFGGYSVTRAEDMLDGGADVLRYFLDGGAWLCVRPSGTEPKLKLYVGACQTTAAALDAELSSLTDAADGLILSLLK